MVLGLSSGAGLVNERLGREFAEMEVCVLSKNSAELLYELFMSWWESGNMPESSRSSVLGDVIEESRQAAVYLGEIERLMESSGFPDDHPLRDAIPKYWDWIFARYSWGGHPNSSYLSRTDIGLLYDFRYHPVNQVGKLAADALQLFAQDLPSLIEEVDSDASLNDDLKRYVKTVLHHAYKVLSVDSFSSSFEQERALSELVMALNLASAQSTDPDKSKGWQEKAASACSHFISGFAGAAGGSAWTLALTATNAAGQIMGS